MSPLIRVADESAILSLSGQAFLLGWFLLGAFLLGYMGEHL
jgi:hypothetical protein